MYNMTFREFSRLMREYNEIEEIKKKALKTYQTRPNRDIPEETKKLMSEFNIKRAAFLKQFKK